MVKSDDVQGKFVELLAAFIKSEKNDGRPVDKTAMAPVTMALEIAATVVEAIVIIAEAQRAISRKDTGYKPGDDVDPEHGR